MKTVRYRCKKCGHEWEVTIGKFPKPPPQCAPCYSAALPYEVVSSVHVEKPSWWRPFKRG